MYALVVNERSVFSDFIEMSFTMQCRADGSMRRERRFSFGKIVTGNHKTCELQRTLFKNVEKAVEIKHAFKSNNVAIALAANDYFVPYLSVTLASIVENSSSKRKYDILILTTDISQENKFTLQNLVSSHNNFSLRFVNPAKK